MRTILVTGATRGLGLALARALDAHDDVALVLGVRDLEAGRAIAKSLRRAEAVSIDTGSLASIRACSATWDRPLHALVNNAGLQITDGDSFRDEGIETTLAVNHLGPLALTLGLLPRLRGGSVVGIGSGTHSPDNQAARLFGFRGGKFTSIEALARGETDGTNDQARGRNRYATSKLLTTVTAIELARRTTIARFATFDPGLMPGTGLARTAPWYARAVWSSVLGWVAPLMDDTSTPERSARSLAKLLVDGPIRSGETYGHDGAISHRLWKGAHDPELGKRIVDESLAALAAHGFDTIGVGKIARPSVSL
jgi:NAD(P)-dependent dehydrogenase (short-subunit alcohol dehydrogenase family)